MGITPPSISNLGELPSSVSDVQGLSKATLASSGFQSGANATNDSLQPLVRIASKAQKFIDMSLMGRGLTVQRFSAAQPGANWNLNFPYRFLVTRVNRNGRHSVVAEYRLPINPQELVVSTPYAIKTTITSRGVLEEHNGTPIKQISITGTTGVYIERASGGAEQKRTDMLGTIFGGTLDAAANAGQQLAVARNSLGLGGRSPFKSSEEDPALTRTGYYQYQMLRLFLDTYAETKKAPNNQDLRLIFESTKDVTAYIVTPVNLTSRRSVQSPEEYLYTIQLLAWATVPDFVGTSPKASVSLLNNDVGDLRRALNSLQTLRRTASSFKNVISAARADVESNIFGPINQSILLVKDLLSIPLDIADLPNNLRLSLQTSVISSWDSLVQTNEELKEKFDGKMQSIKNELSGSNSLISAGDGSAAETFKSSVFDDLSLTANVQLSSLQLTDPQQTAVNDVIEDARNITINQVNTLIGQLNQLSVALEPDISSKSAVDDEWDILYSLNDTVGEMYGLIANGQLNNSNQQKQDGLDNADLATTALAFWNQTAQDNNIPYLSPVGKFLIPMPFGSTLEQLAAVYLGDSTRWMEIAALNGLQSPYIDETGFTYNLINNGSENQINVASNVNLFVNQVVYLSSDTQNSTKRTIIAMAQISDSNFILTLSGASDLENFTVADHSQVKAFLPYTLNSMKKIYIPLDVASDAVEYNTPPITFLNEDLDLIKFSKIDLLLDSNMDLAVTSDGFINLAFGTSNLVQAAKLKLKTPAGSLLLNPEYGAGIEVGSSFADLNLEETAKRISESFASDPRFNEPSSLELIAQPTALFVTMTASVTKDNGILPITLPLTE